MDGTGFTVKFWGVRGSVPSFGVDTVEFGGNTPCMEIHASGRTMVFDAGSGIRALGESLLDRNIADIDLFFTHCHYDHIIGLPFFRPLYHEHVSVRMWSGHLPGRMSTQQIVADFMRSPFFPVGPDAFHAQIDYRDFQPGATIPLSGGITVRTAPLNHPDSAVGYRLEFAGKSACFVTDTEHVPGTPDASVLGLIANTDLVVYDAPYTDAEFDQYRGYGHSTWEEGVRLCRAAGARRLVIFAHWPWRTDSALASIERAADAAFPGTVVAREGMVIAL